MQTGSALFFKNEPTANLDPESTEELAEILKVVKSQGIAIVIVDHRLYWLEGLIDQAVIMEQGQMAWQGCFQELHSRELQNRFGLRATRVSDPRHSLPELPQSNSYVGLRNISFSYYRDKPLFKGLDFDLPQCSVVGMIGPNGAGKTTLARLMVGLLRLGKGEIRINNRPIRPKKLLARTSIVLQNMDHQLHMRTVNQELVTAMGSGSRAIPGQVEQMLDRFNLGHLAQRHPQSLSGGEKQRLVIACGMIRSPEILILDEPTSGLDGRNMAIIAESLKQCAGEKGIVLVISHDLELLAMACTHLLSLESV